MARELVVLQHQPGAGPSAFVDVLDGRGDIAAWRTVHVAEGEPLPDLETVAGLLAMGGAMGVPDQADHPWMEPELALLREAVQAEVPVLGVCLGAQLLGAALGGKVTRRSTPEVGYLPLRRTAAGRDDAVFAGWPDGSAALLLHEDEITDLPDGADVLLEGTEGAAAWRLGSGRAVQAHPEVTAAQLAEWRELDSVAAAIRAGGLAPDELVAEAARRERVAVAHGRALVGRWIDGPVRKHVTD